MRLLIPERVKNGYWYDVSTKEYNYYTKKMLSRATVEFNVPIKFQGYKLRITDEKK